MKKISNLLMMALLAIGMGLTSCDEMLDNAVDPGVMPDVEVTSIALNATSQALNVDDYFALTATVEPADADYTLTWSSSDETIATVDENGIIHAVAEGNAIITAQAGNMKATCDILVQDVYAINQYKEASWDGSKVVFEKKLVAGVGEITNDFSGDIKNGWYSVTGNDVTISANYTLDGDTYLILCDDAQLTINGQINCAAGSGYNLYIYGQGKGNGKLNIKCNGTAINGKVTTNDKILEIHGGDITVESTSASGSSLCGNGFNMYSGKLTATTSTAPQAIQFYSSINVYGGEVIAENTATAADHHGIAGNNVNEVITVYGGKMKVSGGSAPSKAIVGAKFKSGTENIKLYLSADNTSWTDGSVYSTAQAPADSRYIKIE